MLLWLMPAMPVMLQTDPVITLSNPMCSVHELLYSHQQDVVPVLLELPGQTTCELRAHNDTSY